MNSNELIERYLSNNLSAAERTSFELEMDKDPEFKKLVENYPVLKKVGEGILELELLNEFENATAGLNTDNPDKSKTKFLKVGLLVASVLLLSAILYFFRGKDKPSPEKTEEIFIAYYSKPINEDTFRGENKEKELSLDQAKTYFDLNQFDKSVEILETLLAKPSGENELKELEYYLAHNYLNIGRYQEAKKMFLSGNDPQKKCLIVLCDVLSGNLAESALEENCSAR